MMTLVICNFSNVLIVFINCVSVLVMKILHGVVFRWFDSGRDDGLVERELNVVHYVQSPPPQESTEEDERGYFSLPVHNRTIVISVKYSVI